MRLRDRKEAGRLLASKLRAYAGKDEVIVLALPRGGVPVGYEIAQALGAPLDLFLVRMLSVPGNDDLEMGAISTGGATVLNAEVISYLKIPTTTIDSAAAREQLELEKRRRAFCGQRSAPSLRGKTVILVDDGFAPVPTVRSAVQALKQQGATRIVVAVPITSQLLWDTVCCEVDHCVSLTTPDQFGGDPSWYEDFIQPSDSEIRDLLDRAAAR